MQLLSPVLAAAVDLAALWKIALAAVVAGTGGVLAVVMVIAGLDRAEHASSLGPADGAAARRVGGIALAALGVALLAAGIVAGFVAMTHK